MGNYISCTLATPLIKNSKAARVILPGGEVKQFRDSVKAAELMLDCPNFFLSNSQSLHIGRRFSALSADEELEFGNVYLMFPMKRVNSVVTAADLAFFFMAANSAAKRISILPSEIQNYLSESESETESKNRKDDDCPRLSLEGVDLEGFSMHRLSVCRSRKPVLETIKEEQISSR